MFRFMRFVGQNQFARAPNGAIARQNREKVVRLTTTIFKPPFSGTQTASSE
jgi:hypothetical protein